MPNLPSILGLPTPTNEPLGTRDRMGSEKVPNLCACHAHTPSHLWLAWSWESGCPLCGSTKVDVRCGARYRPELCRRFLWKEKGSLRCYTHTNGQKRGAENPAYKDGRTLLRRTPFRVPATLAPDVALALDAPDDGIRPHAALIDARISAALDDLVAGVAGRGAALSRARDVLAARDQDGREDADAAELIERLDAENDDLRLALRGVVDAVADDAAEARLVRLVAERRKLEVATARIEATAHDVGQGTVELFGRWSYAVALGIASVPLPPELAAELGRAVDQRLREVDAADGRWSLPLARGFELGQAAGAGKLGGVAGVVVDGERVDGKIDG